MNATNAAKSESHNYTVVCVGLSTFEKDCYGKRFAWETAKDWAYTARKNVKAMIVKHDGVEVYRATGAKLRALIAEGERCFLADEAAEQEAMELERLHG